MNIDLIVKYLVSLGEIFEFEHDGKKIIYSKRSNKYLPFFGKYIDREEHALETYICHLKIIQLKTINQ